MKGVLFYGFQFPHHGQYSAFLALSKELHDRGVRVSKTSFPKIPAWLPGRVRESLALKWYQLNEYRLKSAFSSGDVVHYFFPENSLFRAPKWKKNGRLVLSCHQPFSYLSHKNTQRKQFFFDGLRAADEVVLMASADIAAYHELAPYSRVRYIPLGVDSDFFFFGSETPNCDDRFRILTVGNWMRDYRLWAETVCKVSALCHTAEFTVIANTKTLASISDNLQGTSSNIRLLEDITDESLREEYRHADLIFIPLQNAQANNALLEGMSCRRPVVITDLPATREYAGEAAWFIAKGCSDDATKKVLQLYKKPDTRFELGRKARERVESYFKWSIIADQYIDLYKSTLAH